MSIIDGIIRLYGLKKSKIKGRFFKVGSKYYYVDIDNLNYLFNTLSRLDANLINSIGLNIVDSRGRATIQFAKLVGREAKTNFVIVDYSEFIRFLKKGFIPKGDELESRGSHDIKILLVRLHEDIYPIGFVRECIDRYIFIIPKEFDTLI